MAFCFPKTVLPLEQLYLCQYIGGADNGIHPYDNIAGCHWIYLHILVETAVEISYLTFADGGLLRHIRSDYGIADSSGDEFHPLWFRDRFLRVQVSRYALLLKPPLLLPVGLLQRHPTLLHPHQHSLHGHLQRHRGHSYQIHQRPGPFHSRCHSYYFGVDYRHSCNSVNGSKQTQLRLGVDQCWSYFSTIGRFYLPYFWEFNLQQNNQLTLP